MALWLRLVRCGFIMWQQLSALQGILETTQPRKPPRNELCFINLMSGDIPPSNKVLHYNFFRFPAPARFVRVFVPIKWSGWLVDQQHRESVSLGVEEIA